MYEEVCTVEFGSEQRKNVLERRPPPLLDSSTDFDVEVVQNYCCVFWRWICGKNERVLFLTVEG